MLTSPLHLNPLTPAHCISIIGEKHECFCFQSILKLSLLDGVGHDKLKSSKAILAMQPCVVRLPKPISISMLTNK